MKKEVNNLWFNIVSVILIIVSVISAIVFSVKESNDRSIMRDEQSHKLYDGWRTEMGYNFTYETFIELKEDNALPLTPKVK